MRMDRLLTWYEQLLKSLDVQIDKDGMTSHVTRTIDEDDGTVTRTVIPLMVSNRRLVLPTHAQQRAGNWTDQIAFHPLSEYIVRGESPVLKHIKALIKIRLTSVFSELALGLVDFALNKHAQEKASPKALLVTAKMPKVSDKTRETLAKIILNSGITGDRQLLSLFIKRGGTLGTTKHARVCIFRSDLLEAFDENEDQIYGVKISKKDHAGIRALIEYILPGVELATTYGSASDSTIAPNLEVLLRTYAKVAMQLNSLIKTHAKHIPNSKDLMIDLEWLEELDNLSELEGLIPALSGNKGDTDDDEDKAPFEGGQLVERPASKAPQLEEKNEVFRSVKMEDIHPKQNQTWNTDHNSWGSDPVRSSSKNDKTVSMSEVTQRLRNASGGNAGGWGAPAHAARGWDQYASRQNNRRDVDWSTAGRPAWGDGARNPGWGNAAGGGSSWGGGGV